MRLFLLLILLPCFAFAQEEDSTFRSPVDFLRKSLLDLRLGPGYRAYENFRRHGRDVTGSHDGLNLLYDARIGPVSITNIFTQAGFTRGKGFRTGLLITYAGDAYEADGIAKREKSFFGGAFLGYKYLTLYARADIQGRKNGVLYNARFAPLLFNLGKSEFFLVLELEHMNRLYVDYYFGIRRWEATALLPAYEGRATYNYSGTLLYVWSITKNLEFLLWGGEKRFGPGVADSPTVGLRHQYYAGTGLMLTIM